MPEEAYAHQDVTDEGIGLWGKMSRRANSSTRMEVACTIIAMQRAIPLRIAADSKAMIDKAMKMKEPRQSRGKRSKGMQPKSILSKD